VRATERLHEIVGVLGSTDAAADLQPADEGIDSLVRRAAAAGLQVRLEHEGPAPAWSPMTSQAAHRVVQESLTNAARHAPGAQVTVTVARQDPGTRIDVVNGAAEQPGDGTGTGQGLIGLDERVRLAGGWLEAGPRPDGGWAVTALLPDGAVVRRGHDRIPGFEPGASRRLARRRLLQTAAVPLGVGLVLVAALAGGQVLTVMQTGLPDDRYDALRLGQPRAEIEPLLPSRRVGEVPTMLAEQPRPAGARCVYYYAGTSLVELDPDLYRLCFADDVLVSKDRLERR
jgi:hypothetical protein